MLFFTENIVPDNIIQNLLNLRKNYTRRFFRLSLLLISIYTVHLFGKLVKRTFQEEVNTKRGGVCRTKPKLSPLLIAMHFAFYFLSDTAIRKPMAFL
jgi:hypothetical protein